MIRVLIAEDQGMVLGALAALLELEPDIEVVGRARDGAEGVELAKTLAPDVVLMDISMPVMDGLEATRAIRERDPDARVVMVTGSNSRFDVDRAKAAGASGYVTKDKIAADLVDAIVEVASR
jgi:DNA-binding NarL/FixJ family response regulator